MNIKKIIAIAASLLILVNTGFAQTAAITGSVISQFGSDLDYGTTGFNATLDGVHIKVNQSVDSSGTGKSGSGETDFYGEVKITGIALEGSTEQAGEEAGLEDFQTYATNSNNWAWEPDRTAYMKLIWGDIAANLYLGPVTVKLFANSGKTAIEKAGNNIWGGLYQNAYDYSIFSGQYGGTDLAKSVGYAWETDKNNYFIGVQNDYSTASGISGADTFFDTYEGIQAGYSLDGIANFNVGVSSNGDWKVDEGTDKDSIVPKEYAVKASVDLKAVDNLTFVFEAARSLNRINVADGSLTDVDTELGLKLGYNLMVGDILIAPVVGADLAMLDDFEEDSALDVSSELEAIMYSVMGGAKINAFATTLTGYYSQNGRKDNPDSAYTISLDVKSVENLTLQASYEYDKLLTDVETKVYTETTGIHAKLGYSIAATDLITVTPSAQVAMSKIADADYTQYLKAALEIDGLVENTTFTLGWDSNELSADNNLGQIVFTTKLAF